MIPEEHKFAVIFIGAPYGDNEGGSLEYTTETEQGARQWLLNHYVNSPRRIDMRIIELDFAEYERYLPMTPREYYSVNDRKKNKHAEGNAQAQAESTLIKENEQRLNNIRNNACI